MPAVFPIQRNKLLINDLGVKLTEKPTASSISWILPSANTPHQIIKDEHGFYNINHLPIETQHNGALYDSGRKILSWHLSENNELILDIHCSEQVNLWTNLSVNNLFINGSGPLVFGGDISCSHSMIAKSESLAFTNTLTCGELLAVEATKGTAFLSSVACETSVIRSGVIYQEGAFKNLVQADFTCNLYYAKDTSQTESPTLRLIADKAILSGQVNSEKHCFIVAKVLDMGVDKTDSSINFSGDNHIKVDYLNCRGSSQIQIGDSQKTSYLEVKKHTVIEPSVECRLNHTSINLHGLTLEGALECNDSQLVVREVVNSGECHFNKGQLVVNKSYIAKEGGELVVCDSQGVFQVGKCLNGQVSFSNSAFIGKSQTVLKGSLTLTNKANLCVTDHVKVGKKASLYMSDCAVEAGKSITVYGATELNKANLNAPLVTCDNDILKVVGYDIRASKQLILAGKPELTQGKVQASKVMIKGDIHLDDARVNAKNIDIKTSDATFSHLRIRSKSLTIQGGADPKDVLFSRSVMSTALLTTSQKMKFDTSSLSIIGKTQTIETLGDGIVFEKSRFISKKPVIQKKNGQLSLQNHSHLSAPSLLSEGNIDCDFSVMYGKRLSQIQGAMTASNSSINFSEDFYVSKSEIYLSDTSKLVVPTVQFCNQSRLKLAKSSSILVSSSLSQDKSSSLKVDNSGVMSKTAILCGPVCVDAGLLVAETLEIYDGFDIANQSVVSVDGLIKAAKDSVISIKDAQVQTTSLQASGQITLSDTLLKVDESIQLTKDGLMILEPGSALLTENLALLGQMEINSSEDKSDKSVPAQLKVNDKLFISSQAMLTGNAPLFVEAGEFLNYGSINLDSSIISRGALFLNEGEIQGDTVYLGYDDAVLNLGDLSARELTVHGSFLNVFGSAYVKESMNCSGLFGFNLGMVCANNYNNTNLFSMNAGLVLPNFSADPKYIFSTGNVMRAGRVALTTALPGYANLINLGFMAPGLVSSVNSAYEVYENSSMDSIQAMRRHEWMPYLGQLNGLTTLGINAATTGYNTSSEFKSLGEKGLFSGLTIPKWEHVGLKAATVFAGSYNDTSLFHLNSGMSVVGSTIKTNLLHTNAGLEASMLSHSINSKWLYNKGISVGSETSFTATSISNDGMIAGGPSLSIIADTLDNHQSGQISGKGAAVLVESIEQDGDLTLSDGFISADKINNSGHSSLDRVGLDIGDLNQDNVLELEGCSGKVDHFNGSHESSTHINDSLVAGTVFDDNGQLDIENSAFKYDEQFQASEGSQVHSKNVSIETGHFIHSGDWDYEQYLEINADEAEIKSGSTLKGAKTSEDALFEVKKDKDSDEDNLEEVSSEKPLDDKVQNHVDPVEPTKEEDSVKTESTPDSLESDKDTMPDSEGDSAEQEKKEPEKEFKPQHILSINAREVDIDGELKGGDYTQIQGAVVEATCEDNEQANETLSQCEKIHIGENANIDLKYGRVVADKLEFEGKASFSNFDLQVAHTNIKQTGHLSEHQTQMKGIDLISEGQFDLLESAVEMSGSVKLSDKAHEKWEDAYIKTDKFIDSSEMSERGQVAIFTDDYIHEGHIKAIQPEDDSDKENLFYVESKTAEFKGSSELDSAVFNIEKFKEAEAFLRGDKQYGKYEVSESLGVEVDSDINLTGKIHRDCGLSAKGKSVKVNTNYTTKHDLTFISTEGDVSLSGNLHAGNVYGKSAAAMYSNASVYADDTIYLKAENQFQNLGGMLNGDQVAIESESILNLSKGSGYKLSTGNKGGVINGRSNVFLEATGGDIVNRGGMIRGGKYTQMIASGDVKNLCTVGSHWNGYDTVYDYDGGLIAGGSGEDTDDIGLFIKAGGKVVSDASDFVSDGVNYIEGDKGLKFGARQQTYVSNNWTTKKWYGKKKKHTEVTTTVKGSTVHSGRGANILCTENGGVESVATRFTSPGGTQVYARDDVNLYSVKAGASIYDSKSSLWGLNKSTHTEYHEDSIPTLFYDNGVTRIVSSDGTIDARGALFIGEGDLEMEAKHRIKFGRDVLNHEITEKTRSVGVFVPGMGGYNASKNGGTWSDIVTAEDATLAKLNRMSHSGSSEELLANCTNLGVDLYNTSNSVMRGLANDSLSGELLARYGLGGAEGFSPSITFSMTESKTSSKYQTLGSEGVDRGGNIKLKAGDGIDLENGVRVHGSGDMDIDAPEILAHASGLHSSFDQRTKTESVSVTSTGQLQSASYSQSKTHAESTNYVNAELSTGGNMTLHHGEGAMDTVVLDGANLSSKTLDADINHLVVIDKQDISTSSTTSASASTNGQISMYKGKSKSKITNQHSGIHVEDGINNNGHTVHVSDAYMEGGKITTEGKNDIKIDHLTAVELHDESHSSGIGLSVNVNDLGRLSGQQSTNDTGEQAIAVAEIIYDHVDYQATQTSVIHGEQGTNIDIGELEGNIHTESIDGRRVTKNEETHLIIDVPITNNTYLESATKNFKEGVDKVTGMVGSLAKSQEEGGPPISEPDKIDIQDKKTAEPEESIDEIDDLERGIISLDPEDTKEMESSLPSIGEEFNAETPSIDTEPDAPPIENDMKEGLTDERWEQLENSPSVLDAKKNLESAEYDYKNDPNSKTKERFNEALKHCVTVIMKEAANNGWDLVKDLTTHEFEKHILDIIGPAANGINLTTKSVMNGHWAIFGLTFNFAIASIDSDVTRDDIVKEAITQSATDFTIGLVVNMAAKEASGPIGWAFVTADVLDKLLYDQTNIEEMFKMGLDMVSKSQNYARNGDYFAAFGAQQAGIMLSQSAGLTQLLHGVNESTNIIKDRYKDKYDKLFRQKKLEVKNKPKKLTSFNEHRFFKADKKEETEKESVNTKIKEEDCHDAIL